MRFMKWISMLTVFAMLFAMLPATVAEDEIIIGMDESADGELEIEVEDDGLEGLDAPDDSSIALENNIIDLDGLEENLLISEEGESTEVFPASNVSGDFEIDDEGRVTRYGGFEKNVVIPDGVTYIGDNAFRDYSDMESVTIPGSVTGIGWFAFAGCSGLKSVTIPEGVRGIGLLAFNGCTALSSVSLPNTLEGIDEGGFSGCTALRSITIPDNVKYLGWHAFSGCTDLKNIKLPVNMTEITDGLFSDCDSLDNLDFLSGITKLSDGLLSDCDGLKSITIPSSVTSISKNAFSNCSNLESIAIHENVTFIDRDAFNGTDNVVIRGTAGSYAETYANGVGIPFNAPVVSFDDSCYDYRDDCAVIYINQSRSLGTIQKPVDLARDLAWSSSNPEVATVDKSGVVKGISQGEAIITAATADGKGKAAQIEVVVPEPTKLWFGDRWGDEVKNLEIELRDASEIHVYSEIPYKDETKVEMPLTLASSDDSIVTAQLSEDNKVMLKAVNLGKATVAATTPDGGKVSVEVEVVRPDAESVKIDQSGPIKLYVGQKYALSATVSPAEAEAKLTWGSNDKKVATVNQDGVVTAVREGYADIYVEIGNDYDDSIEIEVLPTPTKITLNRKKATLGVKERLKLKVNFTPQDVKTPLTWKSSKPKVAAVSKQGVVTPKKPGTAVITVRTKNGKTAKATITVKAAPKSVALNKTGTVELKKGRTLKLKATLPKDTASALTWTSSRPKVASVDQKGNVRALKKGTAVITVKTFNGKTAKVTVAVK